MSYTYPHYISSEKKYDDLMRYCNWCHSSAYIKNYERNENNINIYYYWRNDNDVFKIVYDNYEGIFDKNNFVNLSKYDTMSNQNNIMFCKVIKSIKLKEKNDKYVIFKYDDVLENNSIIDFEFKLNFVDLDYVKNINDETINLNENIKNDYDFAIKSYNELPNDGSNNYYNDNF